MQLFFRLLSLFLLIVTSYVYSSEPRGIIYGEDDRVDINSST